MVFSSEVFLFAFLPAVLALYFLAPGDRPRNLVLVACSLVFYAWGGALYVLLVVGSALVNYVFGRALSRLPGDGTHERRLVVAGKLLVLLSDRGS